MHTLPLFNIGDMVEYEGNPYRVIYFYYDLNLHEFLYIISHCSGSYLNIPVYESNLIYF